MTLVNELVKELRKHGIIVEQSEGDADVMIAEMALRLAEKGKSVVVIADDTDIFCILLHHWQSSMGDIYFQSNMARGNYFGNTFLHFMSSIMQIFGSHV